MILAIDLPEGPEWVLFVLATLIIVGPLVVERLRIPGIIGLLVGGLIIGENGLGIIGDTAIVSEIGAIGLLYLMFLAGLELDLVLFRKYQSAALVFFAFTFTLPFVFGLVGGLLTGYETAAAILIGSIWASHTLVTYPVVKRFGLAGNRSVAVTVGATVLTDTCALLVLAVVSGTETGDESGVRLLAELGLGLVVLVAYCAIVLPFVARWFFKGVGQERMLRFIFVLACLTSAAMVAEEGGIEGIVGAFFAGIALNRQIPNASPLFERTEFFGSSFFIPIFLISVGLLIDLQVLADLETIKLAAIFAAAVVGGKALAAFIAGRAFKFSGAETGVMFALSLPQAAATLAATLIGYDIGLLDQEFVNAAIVVIAASLLIASIAANRFSPEVPAEEEEERRLGSAVLVDVVDPEKASALVAFASRIAQADAGTVVPIFVATSGEEARYSPAEIRETLERAVTAAGFDAEPVFRVDRSHTTGVVNAEMQYEATMLLTARHGGLNAQDIVFGSAGDDIVSASPVPVVIASLSGDPIERVILRVDAPDLRPARWPDVRLAARLARLVGGGSASLVVVTPDVETLERAAEIPGKAERIVAMGATGTWARENAKKGDLFVLPGSLGAWVFGPGPAAIAAIPGVSVAVIAGPGRAGGAVSGQSLGTGVVTGRSA